MAQHILYMDHYMICYFSYLQVRLQGIGAQLEAHLIVTLAGRSMRQVLGPVLLSSLDEGHTDAGSRQRSAEQITLLVDKAHLDRWPNVMLDEIFLYISDDYLPRRRRRRFAIRLKCTMCSHPPLWLRC